MILLLWISIEVCSKSIILKNNRKPYIIRKLLRMLYWWYRNSVKNMLMRCLKVLFLIRRRIRWLRRLKIWKIIIKYCLQRHIFKISRSLELVNLLLILPVLLVHRKDYNWLSLESIKSGICYFVCNNTHENSTKCTNMSYCLEFRLSIKI